MKNIFLSVLLLLTVSVCTAQYNPANFTVSNKAYGVAQAVPTDARSFYYDGSLFVMRPYQSTAEVLSYLNLAKYRIGNFPIYVNFGGTLQSGGTFTGGTITEYWFRDGTADGNLVAKLVPETDPKRVTGVAITGTTTKTVTITLADASTVTGTFTDLSGASTPTLQQVSDVGHVTTTDLTANNFRGASVILNSNGGGGVSTFTNTDGDLNINYGKDGGNVVLAKGTAGTFRDTITKSGTIAMISDLPTGGGSTDTTHLSDRINLKVDKVTGKQLSTEDYSTAEKTKLAGITGTNTGDQDLSSYLTSSIAATTYFPLTGGALTGTAGSGYIGLIPQSSAPSAPATGVRLYARSTGAFSWIGTNGFTRSILGTYLTGDHVWQLQNKDGTFADSADVAGKADKTTTVNGHALSGNVTVTANDVGLGSVNNTSDASKPVSTATQTALDAKQGIIVKQTHTSGATVTISNTTTWLIVNPASIIPSLAITAPSTPIDAQRIEISFGGTITAGAVVTSLVFTPNSGQGILQTSTPSSVEAGETITYRYNSSNLKWYRL